MAFFAVVVFLSLFSPQVVHSQEDSIESARLQDLLSQAKKWYSYSDFVKAEPFFIEALKIMENSSSENCPIYLLTHDLANFYMYFRKYDKAEIFYKRTLDKYMEIYGSKYPGVIKSISELAELYKLIWEYEAAEYLYINEMGMSFDVFGSDSPEVAVCRQKLAALYNNDMLLCKNLGDCSCANSLFNSTSPGIDIITKYQGRRGKPLFSATNKPSPFDGHGRWEMIGGQGVNGSWEADRFEKTRALAVHDGRLYVGLVDNTDENAEVWSFDGKTWRQDGGDGLKGSWSGFNAANALLSVGDTLFCGIGGGDNYSAEVWAFKGDKWRRIGGPGIRGSWGRDKYTVAYSTAYYKGAVYVGMAAESSVSPAVFRFNHGEWEKVAGDNVRRSWAKNESYSIVYELWPHQDGCLYAGLGGQPGDGDVWRFDESTWEQVGGDGLRGSWVNPEMSWALSFATYQGKLVVALPRLPVMKGDFSSIWSYDGVEWKPIGLDFIPELWSNFHDFNFLLPYKGRLYVGAGGAPPGFCSIWELADGVRWRQVAGHGKFGSWTTLVHNRGETHEYVYRMIEYKGKLVAGFGDRKGAAQIWQYTPDVQ
ncbi:MAG: tetratricopeptide repeat protein [Thermodesulfobacteriota bacterium]|nr:tetratricopeptide repeat protein [Thermodesulfobacteriota bacterium]